MTLQPEGTRYEIVDPFASVQVYMFPYRETSVGEYMRAVKGEIDDGEYHEKEVHPQEMCTSLTALSELWKERGNEES